MLLALKNLSLIEEFDYNFIKHALYKYKNPRVKINDLLKKGKIIRVKKGLYVFGSELAREPYSKETLANLIYGPSYISLEYALSFYVLIPERVEIITSVTNKRNKSCNRSRPVLPYQMSITCKPLSCKSLQGAADARRRARRRTNVLQVPANTAGAAPCERLQKCFGFVAVICFIAIDYHIITKRSPNLSYCPFRTIIAVQE